MRETLEYHEGKRPGKIEVKPTKPSNSQRDLSIAYSPGVADPCKAIANDSSKVYNYTAKGNLVAVISDGTAVLGLGDIGPEASKPVMEGKGVLFKIFADIDVFDLELDTKNPDHFVEVVKALGPTFGGINLEDIKSPECFEIEKRLKEEMDIPVMHDDQHGTAIIATAALLNALELVDKKIEDVKVVFSGAGAAAISCARLFISSGVKRSNIIMSDKDGILKTSRKDLSEQHQEFAQNIEAEELSEVMKDADVFLGLSVGNIVSPKMIKSMADDPVVFALANPEPEIAYEKAKKARKDLIMATGRSDNPNQVNNVLGFPFIFRGALDVRATSINEEMKLAAAEAIAQIAKESVPEEVYLAYDETNLQFGKEYIIPKPFDPRLIYKVAPAVARAAMDSGVAKQPIKDWDLYHEELLDRLSNDDKFIRLTQDKAKSKPQRIVMAEGENLNTLKAAQIAHDEGYAKPIILGNEEKIKSLIEEHSLGLEDAQFIDPMVNKELRERYAKLLYQKRMRKGVTIFDASKMLRNRNYFGAAMVEAGDADAFISGVTRKYSEVVRPLFEVIGADPEISKVAGMYIMITKWGPLFFADVTINENPSSEELVEITLQTVEMVKRLRQTPRVAMLSYSNFGSVNVGEPRKIQKAVEVLRKIHPEVIVDGEMQANFALNPELLNESFPFSDLVKNKANTFIFPNLAAGNISYKMLQSFNAAEAIGPLLVGLNKPAHVLQMGSGVREIVNMVTLACVDAQTRK